MKNYTKYNARKQMATELKNYNMDGKQPSYKQISYALSLVKKKLLKMSMLQVSQFIDSTNNELAGIKTANINDYMEEELPY